MQISTISPSTFDDGKPVTLTGSGFGSSQGQVLIGGVAQNVNTWSDDEITFTTVRGSQSLGACRVDVVAGVGIAPFFSDGFETGDRSHTEGGAAWGSERQAYPGGRASADGSAVTVMAGQGSPGYALEMKFAGEPSGNDSSAEQHFDLGAIYSEVTIAFDLYIPDGTEAWGGAAYAHRNDIPGNNKFFRLWPADYADKTKIGASFWRSSTAPNISNTRSDWDTGTGIGPKGQTYTSYIVESDRGTWVAVKFYCKAATSTTNGTLKIYKNGSLIIDNTETVNNYSVLHPEGWRYGYLLGAANSGFTDTTKLMIDNVKFYAGEA